MNRSESIVKLSKALNEAQKNIGAAKKDAKNPFFKSVYADLSSVMEACKDALNAAGISVLQPVVLNADGSHGVETILLHESGEFISSVMKLELKNVTMQDLGSAVSYARRYGLQSMVFIPAADDDAQKVTHGNKLEVKPALEVVTQVNVEPSTQNVETLTRKRTFKKDTSSSNGASASQNTSEF